MNTPANPAPHHDNIPMPSDQAENVAKKPTKSAFLRLRLIFAFVGSVGHSMSNKT